MAIDFCDRGGWRKGDRDTIYAAPKMAAFLLHQRWAAPKTATIVGEAEAGAGWGEVEALGATHDQSGQLRDSLQPVPRPRRCRRRRAAGVRPRSEGADPALSGDGADPALRRQGDRAAAHRAARHLRVV